jgi:2-methylaconitate cis-trans-isomerase PrpF
LPKIAFVTKPVDYHAGSGKLIRASDSDIVGRLFSVGMKMIDAYMGNRRDLHHYGQRNSPGTIVNEIVCSNRPDNHVEYLRIGHPWGIMEVGAD